MTLKFTCICKAVSVEELKIKTKQNHLLGNFRLSWLHSKSLLRINMAIIHVKLFTLNTTAHF